MKKMYKSRAFAAIVLAFVASLPVVAQQAEPSQRMNYHPLQHLAPDAMRAADITTLRTRESELTEAARVYGYNLEEDYWRYEQTICPPMPETILLHYFLIFPDGKESLFTALVPRGKGAIRIVPVLYRSTTPYLPAAKNPRNYALFNSLVPQTIASSARAPGGNLLELGACYAEMAGDRTDFPLGSSIDIASVPPATVHLEAQNNAAGVTFAGNGGVTAYKLWSITFNKHGRVTEARTEEHPVYAANATPEPAAIVQKAILPEETNAQPFIEGAQPQPVTATTNKAAQIPTQTKEQTSAIAQQGAPVAPLAGNLAPSTETTSEAGWKVILHPTAPVWKIVPPAPPPPEKVIPTPPSPLDKSLPPSQTSQ